MLIITNRIVIFSDCQLGTGCKWYDTGTLGNKRLGGDFNKLFQNFRKMSRDTIVYSIDLRGYGNTLFSDGVVELAGWSNGIFDIMQLAEKNKNALLEEINSITL